MGSLQKSFVFSTAPTMKLLHMTLLLVLVCTIYTISNVNAQFASLTSVSSECEQKSIGCGCCNGSCAGTCNSCPGCPGHGCGCQCGRGRCNSLGFTNQRNSCAPGCGRSTAGSCSGCGKK